MKLYTRTGDDGSTGLYGGQRTTKDSLRVESYGTVDELNSVLGLARAACGDEELTDILVRLQSRLFDLGADLCTPFKAPAAKKEVRIQPRHVTELEGMIDAVTGKLEPLQNFVLPGGTELSARLHHARTVSRRAERLIVALSKAEQVGDGTVPYINRVSDLLFAMARRANQLEGVTDIPWVPDEQ
jgi:cob(I)alamin adenosyltransferase